MWWCNYTDVIKSVQILAGGTCCTTVKRGLLLVQFNSNYIAQLSCASISLCLKSRSHMRACVVLLKAGKDLETETGEVVPCPRAGWKQRA